jgi:hypothetical protein
MPVSMLFHALLVVILVLRHIASLKCFFSKSFKDIKPGFYLESSHVQLNGNFFLNQDIVGYWRSNNNFITSGNLKLDVQEPNQVYTIMPFNIDAKQGEYDLIVESNKKVSIDAV